MKSNFNINTFKGVLILTGFGNYLGRKIKAKLGKWANLQDQLEFRINSNNYFLQSTHLAWFKENKLQIFSLLKAFLKSKH